MNNILRFAGKPPQSKVSIGLIPAELRPFIARALFDYAQKCKKRNDQRGKEANINEINALFVMAGRINPAPDGRIVDPHNIGESE